MGNLNKEFSDKFDTLLNSYATIAPYGTPDSPLDIEVDEYEKSVYLTRAEKELVVSFYSGRNPYEISFEEKEEMREALDTLVKTTTPEVIPENELPEGVESSNIYNRSSVFYEIPEDLLYIIFEKVEFNVYLCDGIKRKQALVVPTSHDDLWNMAQNPFKGPSKNKVLRLNAGDNIVELISHNDYPIGSYLLRYVEEPKPIILINLPDGLEIDGLSTETECKLPQILHDRIIDVAVRMALQTKSIGRQPKTESKE